MNQIRLNNFRVFDEPTSFDLAPITILTGKNNSGKSSLIKSFLLLADYFEPGNDQRFMPLNGSRAQKHKLPDYSKVKNWSSLKSFTSFTFQINNYKFHLTFDGVEGAQEPQLLSFKFYYDAINDELMS